MKSTALAFNWFDIMALVVLLAGIIQGRKRGISGELLEVLQWLLIVVVSALLYLPLGNSLAGFSHMTLLSSYLIAYFLVAFTIKLIFSMIKKMVGEKLVQADTFGGMEYYLGMLAGALRFISVLVVALAILNAKFISNPERLAEKKMQSDNFGAISFPTLASLQYSIFTESICGKFVRTHLKDQLIRPTPATAIVGSQLPSNRDLDEVLGNK